MTDSTKPPRHRWSEGHDPVAMPLLLSLHRAQGEALSQARIVWDRHSLSPAEFDVLATLRNAPAPYQLTPTALQASVLITSGGLAKILLQLAQRGLVTRSAEAEDRRIKPVRLTPAGRRLVESAMAEVAETSGAWLRSLLTERQLARLAALLLKLAQ
jgi:DNA-binding MarR family transcriptional regulator